MRTLACLFSLSLIGIVHAESLGETIDALISKRLPHANVGILIKDADSNTVVYSKNADKLFNPASSTKLFTAAAALYHLDPNYHFKTTLSQKGQDYYLTFTGSPSFTDSNLNDLLASLKNNNIKTIKGNFIIDSNHFKPPLYAGGTSIDDLDWYYSAPASAIIINENAEPFDFTTAKELGKPVSIKPKSSTQSLKLINNLITVSKEEAKKHCDLNINILPANTLHLYGCMAQQEQTKTMALAIPDPNLMVRRLTQNILDKQEIALQGKIVHGNTPTGTKTLAEFQSASINALLTHMLHESDNLYANSFTKQLGFSVTGVGSLKQGIFAIKKILSEHTHLDMKQLELADGLGTRYNLATPEQMVVLLTDLYKNQNLRPIILNALPNAGVSGTLKDRMKKTPLEHKVYAKTGTMHDITSLSGYIINPGAKNYVFSIMINGVNKPINVAKSLEEQILIAATQN